jgi:membrane protein required for colicin V production
LPFAAAGAGSRTFHWVKTGENRTMNLLDWVLVGLTGFAVARGIMRGAISQLFGIAGVLGGFLLASHFYLYLGAEVRRSFPGWNIPDAVSFLLLFLLTWFCIGVVGYWIANVLRRTGLGFIDRLWGGMIGLAKAFILGVALVSIVTVFLSPETPFVQESVLVPYIQEAAAVAIQATPGKVRNIFDEKHKQLQRYWMKKKDEEPPRRVPLKGKEAMTGYARAIG